MAGTFHLPPNFASWDEVMAYALEGAKTAATHAEVPVGACIVDADGQVLSVAGNGVTLLNDPTAHAEVLALRAACRAQNNYRLPPGCVLAVTLEPCAMCLGALVHARVDGLVFGARDEKAGAVVSRAEIEDLFAYANHRFAWQDGVRAAECSALLSEFFAARR